MKQLALITLLAALLAGCSASQTKEAAIEDRTLPSAPAKVEEVKVDEAKVVAEKRVEATDAKPQVETKAVDEAKPVDAIQVEPPITPATDPATLPKSDSMPVAWSDLKNPASVLSKRRLLFDYDSAAIRDEYRAMLEAHAQFLRSNSNAQLLLQGHTDERGSRDYNLALGQRRAESVLKALNLLGAPMERMEAVSLGEEKAVAEAHDEAAWQQNRRAELIYSGE